MAEKIDQPEHPKKRGVNRFSHDNFSTVVATNLSLHPATKQKAFETAAAMGYTLSDMVEQMLQRANEWRLRRKKVKPGDIMQIELFDKLVMEKKPRSDRGKNGSV